MNFDTIVQIVSLLITAFFVYGTFQIAKLLARVLETLIEILATARSLLAAQNDIRAKLSNANFPRWR